MALDAAICSRARKAHDPRFDGRFFIGVRTTKVYCRSVCPVRSPKEENVRYFPSAAAAAEAGFRPCMRCRPECSPGTPAWLGTSATLSRALRLIGEGYLDEKGLERLAERLGIGSRHLRRLFLKHLGANPIAIVQTQRLHFAKKLIDETNLRMADIALASGFGSVRRFNAVFRKTYRRTPTQLRNFARKSPALPAHEYRFLLRYRPPLQWDALLTFLAPRVIAGVECIEGRAYRRVFLLHGQIGRIKVELADKANAVCLSISYPEPKWLFLLVERVRRMFDLSADPQEIASHLARDPLLSSRVAAKPGLRVPGCWDGFELGVRAILGQQVTVAGASTLAARLVRKLGTPIVGVRGLTHLFPTPEKIAASDLSGIGLPKARSASIRAFAAAVCDGTIKFDGVTAQEFTPRFLALPGIGAWTAQYVAMRVFGEPDAFPDSDLGLLRAASLTNSRALADRSSAWRPWRAYAAMYLWQGVTKNAQTSLYRNKEPRRMATARG